MQAKRLRRLVVVAALALLAAPAAAQANEVTHWNQIATDTLVAFPGPAGGAAQALQVDMAMVQGAVYDAVNAIEPRHQPYLLGTPFTPTASKDAAATTAAYLVLSNIVSTVPMSITFPNRATLLTNLGSARDASLALVPDGPAKDAGISAGTAAANAMIAARTNDGRFTPSPWVSNPALGHWQPLLNPDGSPQLDPAPWVANVKPFLLKSPSQFRTAGPNALGSTAYAVDYNEVKALGPASGSTRSDEQTHNAIFWQAAGGPALLWNGAARKLADARGLDMGDSALLYAMLNLASADAAISVWNDKYHFDFWRPWQAIHAGDVDPNPGTAGDTAWAALITAPYPEHPSGHVGLDSAALQAMRTFFGTNKLPLEVTSSRFPGEVRTFSKIQEPLKEVIQARIWAGLHFRTADVQSKKLGRQVARYMAKHYFQPLH